VTLLLSGARAGADAAGTSVRACTSLCVRACVVGVHLCIYVRVRACIIFFVCILRVNVCISVCLLVCVPRRLRLHSMPQSSLRTALRERGQECSTLALPMVRRVVVDCSRCRRHHRCLSSSSPIVVVVIIIFFLVVVVIVVCHFVHLVERARTHSLDVVSVECRLPVLCSVASGWTFSPCIGMWVVCVWCVCGGVGVYVWVVLVVAVLAEQRHDMT
jgi:hypothetical protein